MGKQLNHLFRNRLCFPAVSALMLLTLSVPIASAEWYKEYEAGVSSVKKRQYSDAIPHLMAAVKEKPEEGASIKYYGMNFGDYFPHYYLGTCYFHLQNYEAALAELEVSEQQGQIQRKKDLWNQLNQIRTLAKAHVTVNPPNESVESVQPTPPPKETVPIKAEQPSEQEAEPVEVPPSQPPVTSTETVKKQEPPVQSPETVPPVPEKTPEELAQDQAGVLLQGGARKYFQGDYDSAIRLLTGALEANPDEAKGQFLLGCSYAAKYLLSGSQEQTLLQKAAAHFQKVKRMFLNYPGTRSPYISPAILEIYEKTGA